MNESIDEPFESVSSENPNLDSQKKGTRKSAKNPKNAAKPDPQFDEFYQLYPRREARLDARKSWDRVVSEGQATPDQLIAGAMRYSADRIGHDPKYTKLPATWLNKGCWADDPVRATPTIARAIASQRPMSHVERQMEIIQRRKLGEGL
jgi:hypothetical protein